MRRITVFIFAIGHLVNMGYEVIIVPVLPYDI